MAPHWKSGQDFAIRYGGRGKFAWFSNGNLAEIASRIRPVLHPAQLVLTGVEAAVSVGQWWEARKQSALLAAEFEERRFLWCADLLATLCGEISELGMLPRDATVLLERELRRCMLALAKTPRVDVPYSFVLQCQRAARGLVPLNRVMYSELRRAVRNGHKVVVPEYVPYDQLRALLPQTDARPGVVESLRKVLPRVFGNGDDDPLADWMRSTRKDPQLVHLGDLALELRAAEELLDALEGLPDTIRAPEPEEEVADLAGVPLLAASLAARQLPGAG
jgi:hypothetical protein